jgi:nonsense-mediated mRNA decay protein 3
VKCGKDTENTINGLCAECFIDGRKLTSLPHHVDVKVCANCGDVGYGERWVTKDLEDAIEEAAVDSLSIIREAKPVSMEVSSSEQEKYTHVVVIDSILDVGGCIAEDTSSTIVRLKNTVCKRCSRQLGNYYEAILQIRAGSKNVSQRVMREAQNRAEETVDSQSVSNRQLFITKTEEVQGGIDIYLSSISLGKAIAKDLSDAYCAETKEAAKLVGQTEDGQGMFRVTYLVRLPDFHAGDVVQFEGRYFKLARVSGNGAKVIDLMNFRERSIKRPDMLSVKVHERSEDLREATVVSRGKGEIQILSPSDYSAVDISVPDDLAAGDSVKVTDIDGALYYVP